MAKGKLILICQSGGEFVTNDDGTMSYNGGEANAANVTSETPFSDLKLTLAETCDVNQDTATVKYFLPGNKRNLITVKNDKDVKRMIDFHGDALTAEVFVMGTPGFNRSALETQTNRQNATKNDETVNNDNLSPKKDEKIKRAKAGPKKEKVKKDDKVAKSPIASPTRTTRRSIAAAKAEAASQKKKKQKQKEKEKTVSEESGDTSNAESEQVNVNVVSEGSSDVVSSRNGKRKKPDASPADSVKKRKRTPSWKVNGRPTIVSDSAGSKSKPKSKGSSGSKTSQRKSGRLAAKDNKSQEKKSGRKRGRPRAITITSDQEQQEDVVGPVGPTALDMCDDDVSPETLVSLWKSAITGVGQQFTNAHEFHETLRRYAIANDFEFKLKKNDKNRVVGECAEEGCSWKFNAVWAPSTESFKIKTMNNVHKCDKEDKESNNWLLNTIKEKLQESPDLKPKEIANGLLKDVAVDSNRTEVFDGNVVSRDEQLHGSDNDAYNKLPWFCEKIMETNPGSFSKLVVGEDKRFKAMFVSFYASLCGFLNSCRPLLFLEATSMWSKYGEVLITANAIDGNDDFFPVAFAIVDVEDDNNWRWFLGQLKATIFNSQQPITFVFDREKNLKNLKMTVLELFEDSHIGYSIYHLLESFKRNVKGPFHGDGKSYLPFHFLAAAHAVRLVGFKKATEQIKQISSQAYDWVMQIEPQHWTTSSFKGERYNHIIDDVGASFSKLMEDYRELPILHKIDAIIRTMIDAVNDAKLDGSMWSTHLTPSKEKQLQEENMSSSGLKVLISSDTLFEVREDSTHVVNISTWSCTCLGWKETGLPCRHALAVFALIGRNPYEFCSSYFTVDAYRLTYFESINPVPIEKEEVEKIEIEQVAGETELVLNIEGDIAETGEKIEVEEEKVETETKIDNDECEKVEIEDEKGEKMEIEITWGENDESGKVEGEKVEIEKDEGGKGKIAEDDDARVLVLPPIPVKTVDVRKEKMDWDETEVETKRTVTCTKCKQPGHNKKSCNLYQLQQEAC
ncbi:putative transcription factor interactor and regulator CCHC(Zn) family [Helianthus annuus]|uniref:Transcription factor interactor and regulator CCHC(Zn) family n=2 Tax=Helianthus annuus TaxID=4232 RepID=A0A9K3EMR2_HELAN|nr:uncharacterized protein LOC110893894 [Helianthus annuus]KAF5776452.1 putative transcription factor interactor and regulator CCHC(Zn) family [Helianthus annuus]KAJ0861319.1 putative transcription factor interactor and regulator CCHC(Zn) family [Helianthus annuus]